MEVKETELSKSLSIIYQPHPVVPVNGRKEMMTVVQEGTSVREILLNAGVDAYQPIVVMLDDRLLTVEEWDTVCPSNGQMLNVQASVEGGGGGSNVIQTVLLIAVVVAATLVSGGALGPAGLGLLGSSFAAGAAGAIIAGAVIAVGGSLLVNALFPPKTPSDISGTAPEVSPTYSLSGGSNQARPYQSMPVVMGTHRIFFDLASRPYTEYRGEDQYLYQIFNNSLGTVLADDFRIGTTPLLNYTGVDIFASDVNGKLAKFPGNVDSIAGASLPWDPGWVNRTTSTNTYRIGVDIEAVVFRVDNKGVFKEATLEFYLQYAVAGSGNWQAAPFSSDYFPSLSSPSAGVFVITGSTSKPQRGTIFIDVPVGQYDIRIRRSQPESTDTKVTLVLNFPTMRSYQEDTATYKGQNRIGLIIKASEQLNGVIQQLSATVQAEAEYWNGSAWVEAPTSNPAYWFMHFAKGRYNADGKLMYGIGLSDSQIDLASLSAWATFCTVENLTFNAVIDGSQTAADIINIIAKAGFGSPTWASGKLGVVYDARSASPVMTFGMSNIIRDSFEVAYITEQLSDEIVVRFRNPDKDWEQDEVRVTVPGVTSPVSPANIELFGCTNVTMAGKFANYIAAQQYYRKRRITWQTDFEGFVCQRGDVVLLSHDLTQWGYSGRIVSAGTFTVTLDRNVPRSAGGDYLMLIRPDGQTYTYSVAGGVSESDTLTLSTPPQFQSGYDLKDHRWCYSPLATPGKKVKIISVAPASDSRLQIVATDEYPEFYDAWGGTFVPPPDSTVLPLQPVTVTNLTAISRTAYVNGYLKNRVTLSWGTGGGVLYSRVRIYFDGNLVAEQAQNLTRSYEIDFDGAGAFYAEVTPYGVTGAGATVTTALTLTALDLPSPPTNLQLYAGEDSLSATYTWDGVLGVQSYVIAIYVGGVAVRTQNIGNALSYTYTLADAVADGGPYRSYQFRVYSVNQVGQSLTYSSVTFSNPQIAALVNARIEPMPNSMWFRCDLPSDQDFKAIRIWMSKTSGFTPGSTTIVYDGPDNWVNIAADNNGDPLESGVVYYVRAAGYDTFGDDNLTTTGEFSAAILSPAWGLLQGDIDATLLESGLRDRIDLIDAASTVAGSVNARLSSEASIRAQAILDEAAARQTQDQALQTQINTLVAASTGDLQDLFVAIQDEQTARINGDAAEAISREALASQLRGTYTGTDVSLVTTGLVYSERTARTSADEAIASSVTALSSTVDYNYGLLNSAITAEATTRASADSALTSQVNTISAQATKTRTYSQISAPGTGMITGDLWFDTDDNNKAYRYNGTAWVATDDTRIAANAAAITAEAIARADADSSFASQITTISAQATKTRTYSQTSAPTTGMITGDLWFDTDDNNKLYRYSGTAWVASDDARIAINTAAITTEATARANADSALSSSITTLQTTVNGNTTAIQTNATSIDGINAKYTVKIDNNGYVSGYGLISTNNNATPTAEFAVIADRFSIAPVATNPTAVDGSPFFVITAPQTIGGVTVPAGTYMKAAYIHDATITTAKIADAAINSAKILDASIGSAKIANTIQSDNYSSTTGWQINKSGVMNLNQANVRGQINVGAYTGYNWPASGNGVHISEYGILVGNYNNGGRYMQIYTPPGDNNAYIYTNIPAYIEDAQITNAKIGNAQVDTLKIAGQSVTVSSVFQGSGDIQVGNGWTGVLSGGIYISGTQPVYVMVNAFAGGAYFGGIYGDADITGQVYIGGYGSTIVPNLTVKSNNLTNASGAALFTGIPAGNYTILVQFITNAGVGHFIRNPRMIVIETKR